MRLITVLAPHLPTLLSDSPVIAKRDVRAFRDAVEASRALRELLDDERTRIAAAERLAREAAYRAGYEAGRAAAAHDASLELLSMQERYRKAETRLRDRAVDNALAIVRHIASAIGEAETVAALAREAAGALIPATRVAVCVHPDQLDEVESTIEKWRHDDADDTACLAVLDVQADASLAKGQCRLESELGTVMAGLETQLGNIAQRIEDPDHAAASTGSR